jgi:lipopolysaccharide transport system ATP-binding protein
MSSDPRDDFAVSVHSISKSYRLWDTPKDRLKHPMRAILSRWLPLREKTYFREFWALRDVSFDVPKGASLGVIGRNGSGKSTLLQVLCGTLTATSGTYEISGRVSALLELGAGFNPDFTGRENIYMNAAILGFSRAETDEKYEDIVSFADIGDFLDQPVKTYSSGMYVRLAFSVAINVDPDILVVDEALAIGDVLFQNKCYRKFKDLQDAGKTVVFVTHSLDMVTKHCDRAIVLENGGLHYLGSAKEAVNVYLDLLYGPREIRRPKEALVERRPAPVTTRVITEVDGGGFEAFLNNRSKTDNFLNRASYNPNEYRYGDFRARLVDFMIASSGRYDVATCQADEPLDVYLKVYFAEDVDDVVFGLTVQTVDGVDVYGHNTLNLGVDVPRQARGSFCTVKFSMVPNLVSGDYFLALGVAQLDEKRFAVALDRRYAVAAIHVQNSGSGFGIAGLDMSIEVGV